MFELNLGKKPPYDNNEVLNVGLHLAMSFGEDWLQSIQDRLLKEFPELTQQELDGFNRHCQEAMKFGHEIVYSMAEQHGKNTEQNDFHSKFSAKYPWVSPKNIERLFSQGMYYAYKDMGF